MYQTAALPAVAAGGLAVTGTNSLWLGLAAFAMLAAGTAIMRIVPRREGIRAE